MVMLDFALPEIEAGACAATIRAAPRREKLGAACSLRRSLELVLVVGAARSNRLLSATKGLVDIPLEIILKEGKGPYKPGEVLL